nr:MAG TPA: restriction alleviation protein [Caudoviricetes sp.]
MSEIIKTGPFEGWTDIMPITETAEKKLRPCAFCGRMPKTIYAVFSFTRREVCTQVVCMHKGCPVEYTEAPALRMFSVMEWNARPIEDARAARIAELEAERDRLREALERVVKLLDRPMLKDDMCLYMNNAIRVAREALKGAENE